ncbi:MAG: GNAT family N-acetyltransferase [Ruminococcus sp.]|nr:GNAT family N-acetyltransferase [Ruminococcus sp.]
MNKIRQATKSDASRVAEIIVTNYRVNFYPFFKNDPFYFKELNVMDTANKFLNDADMIKRTYVYDDGIIKGVMRVSGNELEKLYVEPQFQNQGIGAKLLEYAVNACNISFLWALEYNTRGIAFYKSHGFKLTGEKMIEDEWVPLLKMELADNSK